MKTFTARKVERIGANVYPTSDKIRCYSAYAIDDGSKVWREENTHEQYVLYRIKGTFYFVPVFSRKGQP